MTGHFEAARWLVVLIAFAAGPALAPAAASENPSEGKGAYRSPIHVCLSPDRSRAYVVNQTSDSVSVIDLRQRRVVDELSVGSFPSHAVCSPDGRLLYVTCNYDSQIQVVDLEAMRVVRTIPAGFEPYGLALSSKGERIAVANALSSTVSMFAAKDGEPLWETRVQRNPKYLTVTRDGTRVLVSNGLSRSVSILDGRTGEIMEIRDLGQAGILRQVVCSPDDRWAFVAHIISRDEITPFQLERGFVHANGISILDLDRTGHRVTVLLDRFLAGAANPWGLALSENAERLYVSLAGVHEVAIVDVPALLSLVAETDTPEKVAALERDVEIMDRRGLMRRVDAGGIGPRGLALNEATGELLVANYFSDSVSILDAETGAIQAVIPLGPPQEMSTWRKGEMLFNDARLCFQQWFSCASCHQEDATVDGFNWDLPNDGVGNAKNVKSLHDIYDTAPAMWTGVRKGMDVAVAAGQRFLGFLPEPENHQALMTFLKSPRRPPNPYKTRDPAMVERGERVFYKARCHACHPAPVFSDLKRHDLGLASSTDLRFRFDTPSLRECVRTGPYLHDGRAQTLREIFTKYNPNNLHGLTSNLADSELQALLEYLRSL